MVTTDRLGALAAAAGALVAVGLLVLMLVLGEARAQSLRVSVRR